MARDFYDPQTMMVKPITELIAELNKLIMGKQPGGRPIATVWGVLCDAARLHRESEPDPDDERESTWSEFRHGQLAGQGYAAHVIIRKIADGMGVSNFKLREAPDGAGNVQGAGGGSSPAYEAEAGQLAEEQAG